MLLQLHGGGYIGGMRNAYRSFAGLYSELGRGMSVLTVDYRVAPEHPYPAALDDCYDALLYLKNHADELGIRTDQIMVGGESAGGGLCVAVCIEARDTGGVKIAFQMPLYPMLDDRDTETSRDNHGKVWNTRKNTFRLENVSAKY